MTLGRHLLDRALPLALVAITGVGCGGDSGSPRRGSFGITGLIEGFYGPPYAFEDRLDLIRFLGELGLDHYLYAPKTDPYHRERWREPYPPDEIERFGELADAATRAGVTLTFAVSPTDIVFTDDQDFAALVAKLDALGDRGVRSFTVSFDDTLPLLADPADLLRYGLDVARAHAELVNRVLAHLRSRDPSAELFFTPMDYNGAIQPYSILLGELLDPGVPVFWTGSGVWSPTVDAGYMGEVAEAHGRAPLLWDNFPANDTIFQHELHLGEYLGRDPGLPRVIGGILLNSMLQARASKVALAELARLSRDPERYDPERAWRESLDEIGGRSPAFHLFAEQTRSSPIETTESVELEQKVDAFYDSFEGGGASFESATAELRELFDRFAAIRGDLRDEVTDTRLLAELEPWIARLESLGAEGRDGLDRIVVARPARPDRAAAFELKALAVAVGLEPYRMCGDAVSRFLSEGADRLARPASSR